MNQDPSRVTGNTVRLGRLLAPLVASVALYGCSLPTGPRPEFGEAMPQDATEEANLTHEEPAVDLEIMQEFTEFIKSEKRESQINEWINDFASQLGSAYSDNPESITIYSDTDKAGRATFNYYLENTDGMYVFSFGGNADEDDKLGLIPDSLYADFVPAKGGGETPADVQSDAYFYYDTDTQSMVSGYINVTQNIDGTEQKYNRYIASSEGVYSTRTSADGNSGEGGLGLSGYQAESVDWNTNNTIQSYLEKALSNLQTTELQESFVSTNTTIPSQAQTAPTLVETK